MIGRVRERIRRFGVIAALNSALPVQEVIEVGDALLASPILVMAISLQSRDALDAIAELRQRYGEHMLIGADDVTSAGQVDDAWRCDAQFLISPAYSEPVAAQARRRGVLLLSGVSNGVEVQAAAASGCRMVNYRSAGARGREILADLTVRFPDMDFVASGGVDLANVADFKRAGAAAVIIGNQRLPHIVWSASTLITQTRALRAAWEAAR